MKKFFTLIAMALVAIGANAQEKGLFDYSTTYVDGQAISTDNATLILGDDMKGWKTSATKVAEEGYLKEFGQTVTITTDDGEKEQYSGITVTGQNNPKDQAESGKGSGINCAEGKTTANLPLNGSYYIFKPAKSGSVQFGIVLNANKALYVLDATDAALTETEKGTYLQVALPDANLHTYTLKDAEGNEVALADDGDAKGGKIVEEKVTGALELDVEGGKTYYFFCTGSKLGCFGYIFTPSDDVPPVVEPTPMELTLASGSDIGKEFAAALASNPNPSEIIITLASGTYTTTESITASCPITFKGENATIDASGLETPMFLMNPIVEDAAGAPYDENGFFPISAVSIADAEIVGLTQQLFFCNQQKYVITNFTCDNCIIHIAGGNKTIFDFGRGGVVGTFNLSNSTLYGDPQHTGYIYSSESGQKATEAGFEMQTFNVTNNTFYNVASGKNLCSHRQNSQKWLTYNLTGNICINSGKAGQFAMGWNKGGSSANPVWNVSNNASLTMDEEGHLTNCEEKTGDDEEPVTNPVLVEEYAEGMAYDKFPNIANGNFAFESTALKEAGIGDPRWLTLSTAISGAKAAAETNDVWYSLQGIRVAQPVKGVYVRNGKKVVVK